MPRSPSHLVQAGRDLARPLPLAAEGAPAELVERVGRRARVRARQRLAQHCGRDHCRARLLRHVAQSVLARLRGGGGAAWARIQQRLESGGGGGAAGGIPLPARPGATHLQVVQPLSKELRADGLHHGPLVHVAVVLEQASIVHRVACTRRES